MISKITLVFLLILSSNSCEKDTVTTMEKDNLKLQELLAEVTKMANSIPCENAEEWTFTPFGSKACGGPQGYIAYSSTIDTIDFLERVENHSIAEQEFNKRWGIVSDCSIPAEPSDIFCENGEPIFEY